MKKLILILLLTVSPFLPQAQENFYTFDITETWDVMGDVGGWSVGNAWNESYAEYEYFGTLDFYGRNLEMMNAKLRVYGDTLNIGTLTLRFPNSGLIVEPTLSTEQPVPEPLELRLYPNPTNVRANFSGVYIERYVVYDLNGRVVRRGSPNSNEFSVIVAGWESGTYVVHLFALENRGIMKKLIVK